MTFSTTAKINKKGNLEIGGCDVVKLAKKFGTPLYVLDEESIVEKCWKYTKTLEVKYPAGLIIYASKALCVTALLKLIKQQGLGVDVSSGGELYTALRAGFDPKNIYMHGNNKTKDEILEGLKAGVGCFVVDNFCELHQLDALSRELNLKASVMLRVNPGIDVHTHDYIRTGTIDSKFGISVPEVLEALAALRNMKNLNYVGLHAHLGSQLFDLKPYLIEVEVMVKLIRDIFEKEGIKSLQLNLGGGIGVPYLEGEEESPIERFVRDICIEVKNKCRDYKVELPKLIFEPGRSIVGGAGSTLYTVGIIKEIPGLKKYIIVDGGMSDNIRPSLYNAKYEALVANKAGADKLDLPVTIAGRCCESGDILVKDIKLPPIDKGDILAVFCTGAYNYSMASNYNRFGRPAMVLVRNGKARLILRRETYKDLVRKDV